MHYNGKRYVTRCEKCKYWSENKDIPDGLMGECRLNNQVWSRDDYCSKAKPKDPHWIDFSEMQGDKLSPLHTCSNCFYATDVPFADLWTHCPSCGAEMCRKDV